MTDDAFLRASFKHRPNNPLSQQQQAYSGFIIVRILTDATAEIDQLDNFLDLIALLQLDDVASILEANEIQNTQRSITSLSPGEIRSLELSAAGSDLPPLNSLTHYWRLDARHLGPAAANVVEQLQETFRLDYAYLEFAVALPTSSTINPDDDPYNYLQEYLDAAPKGIDARWAWSEPYCDGTGIGFVDLEQGWFLDHEDLSKAPTAPIVGVNRTSMPYKYAHHGTATLGVVAADDNDKGIVGGAPNIASMLVTSSYDGSCSNHVANALVKAILFMAPGDVLLLEVERNFLPTEIDIVDFDAIRLASALGMIVIEPAGNGDEDLDDYTDSTSGRRILYRDDSNVHYQESGAIMVAASDYRISTGDHARNPDSNYGERIDCFAWGSNVVSCGHGDFDYAGGEVNEMYGYYFGTSSASAIIAAAALIVQSKYLATTTTRLTPGQMRPILANASTGTASTGSKPIGIMPDLFRIIQTALFLTPDVYLRDAIGDTGAVPSTGSISASPDIIVRPSPVLDPTAAFGEGSGTENSSSLGHQVEAGQDNYIYLRMLNRGGDDANDVTGKVYWSEVATLVTPDMWNPIDRTDPIDVPNTNTLVVTNPITWRKEEIPGPGHYCFIAFLDHERDKAPPIPSGASPIVPFDWDEFTKLIRINNNVAWRNFNVVDNVTDPVITLNFLITGTPDRARRFNFEIDLFLPHDTRAILEVPLYLGRRLTRGLSWKVEQDRQTKRAHIHLPRHTRLGMYDVNLLARERSKAQFHIYRPEKDFFPVTGRHKIAIRQFHEDLEVGRVTWQFGRRSEDGPARLVVPFEKGKTKVNPQFEAVLEAVAAAVKADRKLEVFIAGHATDHKTTEKNLQLSKSRAKAVAELLTKKHDVDKKQLSVEGIGPFSPRVRGSQSEQSPENRRVELWLK